MTDRDRIQSLHFLEDVDCPLLLLNARDDPFLGGYLGLVGSCDCRFE